MFLHFSLRTRRKENNLLCRLSLITSAKMFFATKIITYDYSRNVLSVFFLKKCLRHNTYSLKLHQTLLTDILVQCSLVIILL